MPFPFNIRRTLGGWKFLFLDGKPFKPDPTKSAEWNRGAYLVNGPGHCAECHSPRNMLGGISPASALPAAPNPEGEGWVPNITQGRLKDWNRRGHRLSARDRAEPRRRLRSASKMAPVIRNTSQLSPEDREAMAAYLKSLPPVEGPKRPDGKK